MRVLALDAALGACSVAMVADGAVLAARREVTRAGQAGLLAVMAREVMDAAGAPELIAVTVGPGSFTGLRAALALAHGIALGAGIDVVGVSVGEALAASLAASGALPPGWALWSAIDSRRGRVFLERDGAVVSVALDALPRAPGPVAVAGDAAIAVAARLAARGETVCLTDARLPGVAGVALAALARLAGALGPRAAQPIYGDPPAAALPAGGLRPPPVAFGHG